MRSSQGGQIGYAWQTMGGAPVLVVGGQQGGPPELYFVYQASPIENALAQLRFGLLAAGIAAIAVALLVAGIIARWLLRPVAEAGAAARRIASGDLAARVPERGSDEVGRWAADFNRMADSLEQTVGRLETAQHQNRAFVADVAHELRTPITALVAEASLIEGQLEGLPPDGRRAAELLVRDVRRLRVLVDDLMEVSRFDADAEHPTVEPVDLGRVVTGAVASRLPEAAVTLPASPLVVDTDPRRLDRILGNLLDNARDHAPGSPVEVALTAGSRGRADRRRRPWSGRARGGRPPPVHAVLQGGPVARRRQLGPGARDRRRARRAPRWVAPGALAAGRRDGVRAHAARDRIVTGRRWARHARGRCSVADGTPHRGPTRDHHPATRRPLLLSFLLAAAALVAACGPTAGPLGSPASPALTPAPSGEPTPSDVAPGTPTPAPTETPSEAPTDVPSGEPSGSPSPTPTPTGTPSASGTTIVRAYFVLGSFTGNAGPRPGPARDPGDEGRRPRRDDRSCSGARRASSSRRRPRCTPASPKARS